MASAPTTLSARIVNACAAARHSPRAAVRVTEGELELSFAMLDARRLIVTGTRPAPDFAPISGRAADGSPLVAWHLGLARYYDVTTWSLQPDAFIAGVLADFSPEAFASASAHHTASRP